MRSVCWKAGQLLCTQAACALALRVTLLCAGRAPPPCPSPSHCLDSLPLTSLPPGVSEPRSPLWENKKQSLILELELWGSPCALRLLRCRPSRLPQPTVSLHPQAGGSQERYWYSVSGEMSAPPPPPPPPPVQCLDQKTGQMALFFIVCNSRGINPTQCLRVKS